MAYGSNHILIVIWFYRLEYDAYRSDLELMLQLPKSEATAARIEEAQKNFNVYKISYEKLRDDVNVKLQFLDENRVSKVS
jgi:hypothetical protein